MTDNRPDPIEYCFVLMLLGLDYYKSAVCMNLDGITWLMMALFPEMDKLQAVLSTYRYGKHMTARVEEALS